MASREHIFLSVGGDPEAVASWVASRLGMVVKRDETGSVYVFRPAYAHPGEIGGRIRENVVADPAPELGEESLTDDFDKILDVHYTGRDAAIQRDEAKRLFVDLSSASSSPMALLEGFEIVLGAFTADSGVVWLPAGTTPEYPDRDLWAAYRPSRR